ncbi:glycosyltransferase family 4 protein [Acidimangrovimonas pyrenivorans]|uniref:Glycosyltransferase family 4 protein n=1 Tax=Acidimangrovimonas pyrenivorans TaxID=2030798 RepID=A0ABV7AH26_9RHOB
MAEHGGPPARLLDLSRLVSRAGLAAPTGIDRVEQAYLSELLARPEPLFALVRTTLGFVLLDREGAAALAQRIAGERGWGAADLLGRLSQRRAPLRARAEADLRRLALGRARPRGLARLLRRHLPDGTAYLNTGHSNLSARVFDAVHALPGGRVAVLIHDTIPLDYPQFAAPGLPDAFRARLQRVGAAADLVIYNSARSQADAEHHFALWGRVPPALVSHLGVDLPRPDPSEIPAGLDLGRPWFVTLGTIEPRKNHALLIDIWEAMAKDPPPGGMPRLFVIGRRGWNNAALFARLERSPVMRHHVFELGALPDGAVAALLQGAAGLLFPSFAEGYGLPPLEAAALGVPVLCGDLAIYRETLGDYPVYAEVSDRYLWRRTIEAMADNARMSKGLREGRGEVPRLSTWRDHFGPVLRVT